LGSSGRGGDIAEVLGESGLVRGLLRGGPETVVQRLRILEARGIVSRSIGEVINRGGSGNGIGFFEGKAR
jgi:hypothetical protein